MPTCPPAVETSADRMPVRDSRKWDLACPGIRRHQGRATVIHRWVPPMGRRPKRQRRLSVGTTEGRPREFLHPAVLLSSVPSRRACRPAGRVPVARDLSDRARSANSAWPECRGQRCLRAVVLSTVLRHDCLGRALVSFSGQQRSASTEEPMCHGSGPSRELLLCDEPKLRLAAIILWSYVDQSKRITWRTALPSASASIAELMSSSLMVAEIRASTGSLPSRHSCA